ncbi:hypothetical protein GUJ93_ZPchr0005g15879 [Zizania palustris]|uniref:Uncharacterized protein n=1 Tax=Zizania palustris TaxID=103762 RepID=A0A8J5VG87_ZIZPA|nr:hypothetical protein GUJ93_ZPchr0005g15879 [Zizania palustris]
MSGVERRRRTVRLGYLNSFQLSRAPRARYFLGAPFGKPLVPFPDSPFRVQVVVLAQGSLLSLLSERRRRDSSTSKLSRRADTAKRLVHEQAAEIEDLLPRAARVEALEAQMAEVDTLKARVAELEGL